MAAQTSIKITSDTSEFKKSLEEGKKATSSFTKELRSAKKDALNLTQEFRSLSDEMKNSDYGRNLEKQMQDAIKKAGELQDTFADVNQEISNFASDTQFADGMKLMASSVGNVSSALVALTGDSENMKRVLMDVAKIQATVQAVKSLTDAFQKQNLVLLKNPYVLAATAIAALGVAIYECSKSAKDSKKDLEDYKKVIDEIYTSANLAKYSLADLGKMTGNTANIEKYTGQAKEAAKEIEEINDRLKDLKENGRDALSFKESVLQNKSVNGLIDELETQKKHAETTQKVAQRYVEYYTKSNEQIVKGYKDREKAAQDAAEAEKRASAEAAAEAKRRADEIKRETERLKKEVIRTAIELAQSVNDVMSETDTSKQDRKKSAFHTDLTKMALRGKSSPEQLGIEPIIEEVDDDKLDFTSVLENDWVAVKTLKDIISELNDEMSKAKTPEAYKQYAEQVEKANQKLAEQTEKTDETKDSQKKLQKQMRGTASVVNQAGSAFSALGQSFQLPALNIMGVIGQAIANTALAFGDALAKDQTSKTNIFAFIAASVSAVATMATLISQIKSITSGYANGGIIQGATTIGDLNLARVNDGEMILNGRQQKNLFNMLNNGIERQPVSLDTTNVEFRLRGQELIGVIKNTDKKMSKI